jgi:acyl carrier protein
MIGGSERDRLTEEVTAIVRKAAKIPAKVAIRPESRLVEDLAIDSLDLVSLVLQFQDRFDVVFDEDAVPNLCRVADIVDYLDASRGAPAASIVQGGRFGDGVARAVVND